MLSPSTAKGRIPVKLGLAANAPSQYGGRRMYVDISRQS